MTQIALSADLSVSRFSFAHYAAAYRAPLVAAVRRYRAQSWDGIPSDMAVEKMADRLLRDFWPTPAVMRKKQAVGVMAPLMIVANWTDDMRAFLGWRRQPYENYASVEGLEAAYNEAVRAARLYVCNSLPRSELQPR
jgi:hypothetical protein